MVVEFLAEELRRDRERALWLYRRKEIWIAIFCKVLISIQPHLDLCGFKQGKKMGACVCVNLGFRGINFDLWTE